MARSDNYSLSLQVPLIAAGSALLVGLCLLWMAVRASDYVYGEQEERYAQALAQQVAESLRDSLQSGDLLAARATLQRYVDTSLARGIEVRDVEGSALGSAGNPAPAGAVHRATITIGGDVAGEVFLVVDEGASKESRWRLLFSLLALVAALSLLVFLGTRVYARGLALRMRALESSLALPGTSADADAANELTRLEHRISDLPLDMLRGHAPVPPAATAFHDSAVLFIHLASLARYVDTLNETNLHRYTRRLQQIVQAAAHCYAGEDIRVARPFGLLLTFSPRPNTGSVALRAASCARLVARIAAGLDERTSLSFDLAMAVGHCEEDADDVEDIYPELHLQGAIDDLRSACLAGPGAGLILADGKVIEDEQLTGARTRVPEIEGLAEAELLELQALDDEQETLLEHQARLIVERIAPQRA